MDEHAWLASTDAYAMLDRLFPHDGVESVEPQSRKSRLYLIACARRAAAQLPGICRVVVNLAEQVYGGQETDRALRDQAYPLAESLTHCRGDVEDLKSIAEELVTRGHATPDEVRVRAKIAPEIWCGYSHLAYYPFSPTMPVFRRIPVVLHSARLIREVFGNPFCRVPPMRNDWRTDNVTQLAQQAATTANFTILPILADALEDAGCTQREVLHHLRHGGPHVRGCWALEWVLTEPLK